MRTIYFHAMNEELTSRFSQPRCYHYNEQNEDTILNRLISKKISHISWLVNQIGIVKVCFSWSVLSSKNIFIYFEFICMANLIHQILLLLNYRVCVGRVQATWLHKEITFNCKITETKWLLCSDMQKKIGRKRNRQMKEKSKTKNKYMWNKMGLTKNVGKQTADRRNNLIKKKMRIKE